MRTRFDKQLEQLHVELIKMGSLCEQAITLAAQALDQPERDVVKKVAAMEGEIDEKEREIDVRWPAAEALHRKSAGCPAGSPPYG